jgi:hypothetical protein
LPAHLAELSPDSVRGFLRGFGYRCGVTVFLLAAAVTAMGPERRAASTIAES